MTNFLLDPNIAYLLLVAGVFMGLMALVSPGTGALEIGSLFCLALAGYAIYSLSFSTWALIVLILSIVPFIIAIRRKNKWRDWLLGLTVLMVIIGSVYLFRTEENKAAVNPVLATVTSVLTGGFLWLVLNKSLQAFQVRPSHDLGSLIGQIGEAKTKIHAEGSVQVDGELWSARSEKTITAGSAVRVVDRDGFILVVEKEK